MPEEIIEEPNVFIQAVSSLEARTILVLIFWMILAVLLSQASISEITFRELILASPIVTYLLKKL